MSKHKWKIDREVMRLVNNGEATLPITMKSTNGEKIVICEVWKINDSLASVTKDKFAMANARLIAAAPELLNACEEVLSFAGARLSDSVKTILECAVKQAKEKP